MSPYLRSRFLAAALAVAVLGTALGAQQDERWRSLEQQIDRIYLANDYALPRFGPATMARRRQRLHDR